MMDILEQSGARRRHRVAPLLKEREQYLSHLLQRGTSQHRVRSVAAYLIHIIRLMALTTLRKVDLEEIKRAGERWANYRGLHRRRRAGRSRKQLRPILLGKQKSLENRLPEERKVLEQKLRYALSEKQAPPGIPAALRKLFGAGAATTPLKPPGRFHLENHSEPVEPAETRLFRTDRIQVALFEFLQKVIMSTAGRTCNHNESSSVPRPFPARKTAGVSMQPYSLLNPVWDVLNSSV